jgi:hypothetical protein
VSIVMVVVVVVVVVAVELVAAAVVGTISGKQDISLPLPSATPPALPPHPPGRRGRGQRDSRCGHA